MHYLKFQDILDGMLDRGIRVFNLNDIAKLMNKPRNYASLMVNKSKKVMTIENGRYYLKGADIYEIASNITRPSYVSLFSAFRYYNLTTQLPIRISVMTTKRHKSLKVEGYMIDFFTFSKDRFFGYFKERNAYIASAEKAILDSLYLNKVPFDEIKEAMDEGVREDVINVKRLKEYALCMHSKMLVSRLIMLMQALGMDTKDLHRFSSHRSPKILGYKRGKPI